MKLSVVVFAAASVVSAFPQVITRAPTAATSAITPRPTIPPPKSYPCNHPRNACNWHQWPEYQNVKIAHCSKLYISLWSACGWTGCIQWIQDPLWDCYKVATA